MSVDNQANFRLLTDYVRGRRADAIRIVTGVSSIVGGFNGRQVEVASDYVEEQLRARDEIFTQLIRGTSFDSVVSVNRPMLVPRVAVQRRDIVWEGTPTSRDDDPQSRITIGARKEVASQWELSDRHLDVLACLLSEDEQNSQISRRLKITDHTVKTHLEQIYERLGVPGKLPAALKTLREGILFWVVD